MRQSHILKRVRIKLKQRHIKEWKTLLHNQQTVLILIGGENAGKFSFYRENGVASIDLTHQQTARLIKLLTSQRQERDQLRARHQREVALLKQAAATSEESSN